MAIFIIIHQQMFIQNWICWNSSTAQVDIHGRVGVSRQTQTFYLLKGSIPTEFTPTTPTTFDCSRNHQPSRGRGLPPHTGDRTHGAHSLPAAVRRAARQPRTKSPPRTSAKRVCWLGERCRSRWRLYSVVMSVSITSHRRTAQHRAT